MSGSKTTGRSEVHSAPFEQNVSFPQETQQLLTQTGQALSNKLGSSSGNAGNQYLASFTQGQNTYTQNPYTTQALDALRAQSKDQYARDVANAFSGSQGYGYGVTNRNISDAYNNYQLQLGQALADAQLAQYNQDVANQLEAAKQLQGTAAEQDMQAAQLAIALAEATKREYGTQPVTTQTTYQPNSFLGGILGF